MFEEKIRFLASGFLFTCGNFTSIFTVFNSRTAIAGGYYWPSLGFFFISSS